MEYMYIYTTFMLPSRDKTLISSGFNVHFFIKINTLWFWMYPVSKGIKFVNFNKDKQNLCNS